MEIKYIAAITKEDLNRNVVILCRDANELPCILIKNSNESIKRKVNSTDNMEIRENLVLECEGSKYYVHLICSKKPMSEDFKVVYDYVFNNIKENIDDESLDLLVNSLDEYFHITPEKDRENLQIGVFGELLTIKYIYDSGYKEILDKYHKDFYSKHDVEISDKLRLEIKTTNCEKRIHCFKHNQISRDDVEVYIASSIIEKAAIGKSLYDMFEEVIGLYADYASKFELELLKKKCGVSFENRGIIISYDKAKTNLKFFSANDLPRIKFEIPRGLTNVQYDVDCSLASDIKISNLISIFRF